MISATGAGGHSSSPQPVTANPVRTLTLWGRCGVSPLKGVRRQRSVGQGEGFPPPPENVSDALKDSSVAIASYDIGENMRGLVGVVGPTRMDYATVAARLSYFAESLSRMFEKPRELPPGEENKK